MPIDGIGFSGIVTQYAMAIALTLGALTIFLYFYRRESGSFDEDAKNEMMKYD